MERTLSSLKTSSSIMRRLCGQRQRMAERTLIWILFVSTENGRQTRLFDGAPRGTSKRKYEFHKKKRLDNTNLQVKIQHCFQSCQLLREKPAKPFSKMHRYLINYFNSFNITMSGQHISQTKIASNPEFNQCI